MRVSEVSASVVLLYHRMGSPLVRSIVRGQYVLPAFFRWQLKSLSARGYRPAALGELLSGEAAEAPRFSVTFDDGYASVKRLALPILVSRGIPSTLFAVVGALGKTNSWDEQAGDRSEPIVSVADLREMAAAGVEIGSHGLTHRRLTELAEEELRREVAHSKGALEDLLGRPVAGFSYPYGAWDSRVRQVVAEAGYQYAVATGLGAVGAMTDPLAIPRINMRWNTVGTLFTGKLRKALLAAGRQAHAHT